MSAEHSDSGSSRGGPSGARRGGPRGGGQRGNDRRNSAGRQRGAVRSPEQRTEQAPSARRRGSDPARQAAFEVLREVAESDAYANLVLPPTLRRGQVRGRDAAFATELTYGTLRMQGRYDAIIAQCVDRPLDQLDAPVLDLLRLGAHQLLGMRVPPHAAVSETVGLARANVGAGSAQFINAVLRAVSREPLETWLERIAGPNGSTQTDELAGLAVAASHPEWIVRAFRDALVGAGRDVTELPELLEANNDAPRVTLVGRPGLVTVEELADEAREQRGPEPVRVTPGKYADTAGVLSGSDPAMIPAVRAGAAGVQDEGSQLVTLAFVDVPVDGPDERWLDMCAGPGGKAALLAAIAGERDARIVANEVAEHRARLVEKALQAVPADAVEDVRVGDGREIGQVEPAAYDRVLLDAPCTGLGALRRRPEARWRRTPKDLAVLAQLQRELLASALDAVRPGGIVGYVTCSPHLAETQLVVSDVLTGRDDVEMLDARRAVRGVSVSAIDLPDRLDVQLWPHIHGTDAMHLTLLRRLEA